MSDLNDRMDFSNINYKYDKSNRYGKLILQVQYVYDVYACHIICNAVQELCARLDLKIFFKVLDCQSH